MILSRYFSKKNRVAKFWALIITLLIWVAVVSGHTEKRSFDIRTSFIVGEDKIITSEIPSYIHIEVESNLFHLLSIPSTAFAVSKDLSHLQRNKLTVYFDSQDFPHLSNVNITSIYPKKVFVKISQKISKNVAVDPYVSGRPLFGYRIAKATVEPSRITIVGPQEELEDLETISTNRINITGRKDMLMTTVPILIGNPHIAVDGDESVKVTVALERDIQNREFRFVPLQIEGDAVATIKPATVGVYLRGPIDLLEQLKQDGFSATVPYKPLKTYHVSDYTIANLPESVTVIRQQKIKKITITIRKKPTDNRKQHKKQKR